jgi:small subunit ribosomal protein S5|tara:strand:+ start:9555 stop:10184 length:630 start_codon:yes stop_codon:yes gene_type:complete
MEINEETTSKNKSLKPSNRENFSNRNSRKRGPIRLSKIKYEEKIVQVKRVTKVTTGGKKMTFRAIVIIGDNKRKVGVGIGRAEDVNLAIDKAILNGKKNLITVPLTLKYSVPHVIKASYGACKIMLRPASLGTGVIAGGSVKTVLELAGIKNISAKQLGSNNILNNAKATIRALILLNEKIELGKTQSNRKYLFYDKVMKKYKNARSNN